MSTFLVAHGSWSAGWAWQKMHPLMAARGHRLITPTYTGIGALSHLAHKDINLDTHIEDMLRVLFYEDLSDVILIGHSYGGMVATGVADRARDRIKHLVYLDAYAPEEGCGAAPGGGGVPGASQTKISRPAVSEGRAVTRICFEYCAQCCRAISICSFSLVTASGTMPPVLLPLIDLLLVQLKPLAVQPAARPANAINPTLHARIFLSRTSFSFAASLSRTRGRRKAITRRASCAGSWKLSCTGRRCACLG